MTIGIILLITTLSIAAAQTGIILVNDFNISDIQLRKRK